MLNRILDRYSLQATWVAAGIVFCMMVFAMAGANAQDTITVGPSTTDTVVRLGPIWDGLVPYIVAALGSLITAVVAWAAYLFQRMTGANLDAKAREALHSAAMTGVNLALQRAGSAVNNLSVDTKSRIVAQGVEWMLQSVPGSIDRLGLNPQQLGELVLSKIPTPAVVPPAQVGTGGNS